MFRTIDLAANQDNWDIITGVALAAVVIMWALARFWARSSMEPKDDQIDTPNIDRVNRRALKNMNDSEPSESDERQEQVPDDLINIVENKQKDSGPTKSG
ncbi:MAG TPA: hypothetical protein VMG59_02205 [Phycisphaerae bacterium]|nr:hypothetical protein [Phycisphaerae bacterium]